MRMIEIRRRVGDNAGSVRRSSLRSNFHKFAYIRGSPSGVALRVLVCLGLFSGTQMEGEVVELEHAPAPADNPLKGFVPYGGRGEVEGATVAPALRSEFVILLLNHFPGLKARGYGPSRLRRWWKPW